MNTECYICEFFDVWYGLDGMYFEVILIFAHVLGNCLFKLIIYFQWV